MKSLPAHALRSLIISHKKLVEQRVTLENQIRGLAIVFGDLAAPVPVDPDGDQHRLAHDHAGLAHLLIVSVEDQVSKRLGEGRPAKASRLSSRRLLMAEMGGSREGMAAQLLSGRLDLAGRDAPHVHVAKVATSTIADLASLLVMAGFPLRGIGDFNITSPS